MPVLDPFIEPLRGTAAQTLIIALLILDRRRRKAKGKDTEEAV